LFAVLGGPAWAADPIVRGLYWNYRSADTFNDMDQSLLTIRSMGVTRVHFWMNEPPTERALLRCDDVFGFEDQRGRDARRFVRALKDAGLKVVLTFSPYVAIRDYVDSLFGRDGPVTIAREFRDVDVELDLEGNWTDGYAPASCSKLVSAAEAKAAFVVALRANAPGVALGISTDTSRFGTHATIIRLADWVSPQLYSSKTFLSDFRKVRALGRPVWPALSVQAATDRATFDGLLKTVDQLRACDPGVVDGYVIWGRRQIKTTAYAGPYLAGHPPTADRERCAQTR
jgi:hypothetical protein